MQAASKSASNEPKKVWRDREDVFDHAPDVDDGGGVTENPEGAVLPPQGPGRHSLPAGDLSQSNFLGFPLPG